jgi:hypothetical protein
MSHGSKATKPVVFTYAIRASFHSKWYLAWESIGFKPTVLTPPIAPTDQQKLRLHGGLMRWSVMALRAPVNHVSLFVEPNIIPASRFMIDMHMMRYAGKDQLVTLGGCDAVLGTASAFHRYVGMLAAYPRPDDMPESLISAAAMIHTRDHFPEFIVDFDLIRCPATATDASLIDMEMETRHALTNDPQPVTT